MKKSDYPSPVKVNVFLFSGTSPKPSEGVGCEHWIIANQHLGRTESMQWAIILVLLFMLLVINYIEYGVITL